MNAPALVPLGRRVGNALASAPSALLAYWAFALVVSLAQLLFLFPGLEPLRARVVPYTGWLVGGGYMATLAFVPPLIFQHRWRPALRTFGLTLQLVFGLIVPGLLALSRIGAEDFGNPYLTISPWQPVWTILLPMAWIAVFHSPAINRFCQATPPPVLA
jgi:hypothetical protein